MKVLYLAYYLSPEIGAGPRLLFELGESLAALGHPGTIVAPFPRYHMPVMPARYRHRLWCREETGGMTVLRINVPNYNTENKMVRGILQQVTPWMLALRALPLERPDVVFCMTPPLMLGITARFVARRFRAPCVINVQDLFPQNAIDLGVLRSRVLVHGFEAMERFIYKADAITVMSDGNGDYVVAKGADPRKVSTVFNWVDTDSIRPGQRCNEFRQRHELADKFVVLFAGTMGWSQGLDTVVEAARLLAAEPKLLFLLIGDGVELANLEKQAAGLPNVRFLPMQPKEVYPQVLAACDAALVTLHEGVTTPTVPSKIGTIMAAGRPILASLPPGDAPRIISDAQCGIVVQAGDPQALAAAALTLSRDPAQARHLGIKAREYAEAHLARMSCVRRTLDVLQSAVAEYRGGKCAAASVLV